MARTRNAAAAAYARHSYNASNQFAISSNQLPPPPSKQLTIPSRAALGFRHRPHRGTRSPRPPSSPATSSTQELRSTFRPAGAAGGESRQHWSSHAGSRRPPPRHGGRRPSSEAALPLPLPRTVESRIHLASRKGGNCSKSRGEGRDDGTYR
jgi:hypothetical protein